VFQNSTRTDQPVNCTPALDERHLTELRDGSAIPQDLIAERGYRTVTDAAELRSLGFADFQARPGLLIPLHDTYGRNSRFALKPDQPRSSSGKIVKYEQPAGQAPIIDVPRACLSSLLSPVVDLFITEGVKKADAIAGTGVRLR